MALSALDDLSAEPTRDDVAAVLGTAMGVWTELEGWLIEHATS